MDPATTGALISAGGSLAGGLIGGGEKKPRYKQALEALKNQRRSEPKWIMEGAKLAGIHPLVAFGSAGNPVQPSAAIGSNTPNFLADMGQDIGRAVEAHQSRGERVQGKLVQSLEIENMGLQNDLLRSQIARNNSAQLGPGIPSGSRYISPDVIENPRDLTASEHDKPQTVVGSVNDYGYGWTDKGLIRVPSPDMKQLMEDDMFQQAGWQVRNNIMPRIANVFKSAPREVLDEVRRKGYRGAYWQSGSWRPYK